MRGRRVLAALVVSLVPITVIGAKSAGASRYTGPSARLDVSSGPVGQSVNVYGSGWPGNATVSLYFNGANVSSFWTNGSGHLSDNWSVPQSSAGTYPVKVVSGGASATLSFTITGGSTTSNGIISSTTTTTVAPTTSTTVLSNGSAPSGGDKIAIPAYWYPDSANATSTNDVLAAGGSQVPFIIADVTSSGAGSSIDSNWYSAIQSYHQAGIKVFGYVDTQSGARSLSSAESDVSNWYAWYGVDGIFFDVASTNPSLAGPGAYYNQLYNYVKSMTGGSTTVVLNPGTVTDQSYMADSDIICDFEDTEAAYATATFPSWRNSYPASRFWHMIYSSAGTTQMQNDVALSQQRNAGYVFVTTLGGSNPYGSMPSSTFWSAELAGA